MPITTDFDIFISRCVKNGAVIPEKPTLCDDILELIGNRVVQIRHKKSFSKVLGNIQELGDFEWISVKWDICVSNMLFCRAGVVGDFLHLFTGKQFKYDCYDCDCNVETKYCEGCNKDYCEDCEYMEEPEDCMYYCSRCYDEYCEEESEEESD